MFKYKRAGIIVINILGEILLVKGVKWGFPKGKIEENETVKICAIREFTEETGMILPCFTLNEKNIFSCHGCCYFLLNINSITLPKNSIGPDPNEIVDVGWFNPNNITTFVMNKGLRKYLKYNTPTVKVTITATLSIKSKKYQKIGKKIGVIDDDGWTMIINSVKKFRI